MVLTVLAALAAPGVASADPPSPTPAAGNGGSIGLRLLEAPVTARDDPRARVYIVDHLAPGAVISRRIEVSNTTGGVAHVELYPAAASITHSSFLGAAAHTPNELSSWTSVSPTAADVPARGHTTATVTIAVPRDAAPGEQYGVVWAEVRSAPAAGITQVSRVGIRLYLSVGAGGPPAANFTINSLTAGRTPDGQPTVLASVHNTGGRALDKNGTLQLLTGPGGLSAGPFPANLGTTLAIGDTEPVTVTLDKQLPAGPWNAHITLKSGLLAHTAAATITFPATGSAVTVPTTNSPGRPWLAAAGIPALLLAALAALLIIVLRRRRRAPDKLTPDNEREPVTTS